MNSPHDQPPIPAPRRWGTLFFVYFMSSLVCLAIVCAMVPQYYYGAWMLLVPLGPLSAVVGLLLIAPIFMVIYPVFLVQFVLTLLAIERYHRTGTPRSLLQAVWAVATWSLPNVILVFIAYLLDAFYGG